MKQNKESTVNGYILPRRSKENKSVRQNKLLYSIVLNEIATCSEKFKRLTGLYKGARKMFNFQGVRKRQNGFTFSSCFVPCMVAFA